MIKKSRLGYLFNKNKFVIFISIFAAIVLWTVIIVIYNPDSTITINNVPVEVNLQGSASEKLGMEVVDALNIQKVSVSVKGSKFTIGKLTPVDFEIYAIISDVTEPGTYDLELQNRNSNLKDYSIVDINPKTIKVSFDRMNSKEFKIVPEIKNLHTAPGYIIEEPHTSIETVTVTGPERILNTVDSVIASVEADDNGISKAQIFDATIQLLDKNKNEIINSSLTISPATTKITVPVFRRKELNLKVDFINQPEYYQTHPLNLNFDPEKIIDVYGPEDVLNPINDINIGTIDFNDITPTSKFVFDVKLPAGVNKNISEISKVTVTPDLSAFSMISIEVTRFDVINVPENKKVEVKTPKITDVKIMCPTSIKSEINSANIIAQIDYQNLTTTNGTCETNVKIITDGKKNSWSTGDYNATVSIENTASSEPPE